jgi:hypothetical protein
MPDRLDTALQIEGMLARGWAWSEHHPNRLVHPADHGLYVCIDRATDTMTLSQALVRALDLVIPTPVSKGAFWRRTSEW